MVKCKWTRARKIYKIEQDEIPCFNCVKREKRFVHIFYICFSTQLDGFTRNLNNFVTNRYSKSLEQS